MTDEELDMVGAMMRKTKELEAEIASLDKMEDQIIEERDRAEAYADELSTWIEIITGKQIGEHSNMNNPWENALDAAASFVINRPGNGL